MLKRFNPSAEAVTLTCTSRYHSIEPAPGYRRQGAAKIALAAALRGLKPGDAVSVDGVETVFVGFSHAKRCPYTFGYIPKILVRSPNGDVFVSIYRLDAATS
jgi:hypothetical protein